MKKCKNCGVIIRLRSIFETIGKSKYVHIQTLQEEMQRKKEGKICTNPEPSQFYEKSGKAVTKCPDCDMEIKDEFPEVDYVNCSGCPRVFERTNPNPEPETKPKFTEPLGKHLLILRKK